MVHQQKERNLDYKFVLLFLFLVYLNCCHAFHFVEIGIRIRISPPQRIYNSKIILPSISVSILEQQQPSTRKTPVIMMMKNLDDTEETETKTITDSSSSSSEHFDLDRWQLVVMM